MLPELKILLISAMPIGELRVALPLAIGYYHLSFTQAFFWSVLGNFFPIPFIIIFLEKFSAYLMRRNYYFNRFFNWLFSYTRRRHSKKFEYWGALALVLFVAIPLPLTGAWSGAVAAFVFGIPFKKALPLIGLGIILAGLIVSGLTLGFLSFG